MSFSYSHIHRPLNISPFYSITFEVQPSLAFDMADGMDIDTPLNEDIAKPVPPISKPTKSNQIYQTTIKTPPYAYAHLELITANQESVLDELTLRQYLTEALRQFLGLTGMGMFIDILKVSGRESWVRVPRQDLGALAAALTAWTGSGAFVSGFRICAAGNWLGALVGRHDQRKLWGES